MVFHLVSAHKQTPFQTHTQKFFQKNGEYFFCKALYGLLLIWITLYTTSQDLIRALKLTCLKIGGTRYISFDSKDINPISYSPPRFNKNASVYTFTISVIQLMSNVLIDFLIFKYVGWFQVCTFHKESEKYISQKLILYDERGMTEPNRYCHLPIILVIYSLIIKAYNIYSSI